MWIYQHHERSKRRVAKDLGARNCIYCSTELETPKTQTREWDSDDPALVETTITTVRFCPGCGWWTAAKNLVTTRPGRGAFIVKCGTTGVLRNLDLTDQAIPLREIRKYLMARYSSRHTLPWQTVEDVVVSVYTDLGYDVEATGRTGDGGIDAVIRGSNGTFVGIQVKRYKGRIEAAQIREFVGALHLRGMLRGIYITTSAYSKGARTVERLSRFRRMAVDLVDAPKFYHQLGLAQRQTYEWRDDPTAPWNDIVPPIVLGYEFDMQSRSDA